MASDGLGSWQLCRVERAAGTAGASGFSLVTDGDIISEPVASPPLTVAMSPAKRERTEWAVAKLTELGIDRIVPLICERTVVRPSALRPDRLRTIIKESAAQSRRVMLPELAEPVRFAELVASCPPGGFSVAEPGGGPVSMERPIVLVGPEGGFTPGELEQAAARGGNLVGLGHGVLRVETAAVAAGVLLGSARGMPTSPVPLATEH